MLKVGILYVCISKMFDTIFHSYDLNWVFLSSAPEDQFLLDLSRSLLSEVSWSSKGKYGTLRILAESLKVSTLLQYNPDLAHDILNNLKEQTVACYVSVYVDFKIYCFDF